MSFDKVVHSLTQLASGLYIRTLKDGYPHTDRIGTCCGSRVLNERHTNNVSLDFTVPYGLQFYLNRLDPPDPREQFSKWTSDIPYTAVEHLRHHQWTHKTVNLPEINCSYTIVIAETFEDDEEEDEDDEDWDD